MANFLKTYAVVLVVFWAFVLALLVAAFTAQGEKIEQLEKRVSELEEKDGD